MQAQSHPDGELSDERQLLETLLNTRANFSLVVFGLAVAAVGTLGTAWLQFAVLLVSGLLSALLAFTISRVQWKLDLTIERLPADHPAKKIDDVAAEEAPKLAWLKRWVVGKNRRRVIGYMIPWATTVLLLVAAPLAAFGVFADTSAPASSPFEPQSHTLQMEEELRELRAELLSIRRELRELQDAGASTTQQPSSAPGR